MTTKKEKEILRTLAAKVSEIAHLPEMEERKRRWYNFIELKPERPMVLCYPEGSWCELLPDSILECEDPLLREFEWKLRSQIYWWENIHDDNTIEPWFDIKWIVETNGYGVEVERIYGENRGSYQWETPIKDFDKDFEKLHIREFFVDREKTFQSVELADSIFGDYLPVRIRGNPFCNAMTRRATEFVGLDNLMLLMYDDPENVHKLMEFMYKDYMHMLDWYEKEGLLTPCNENDYVGSGGVAYTHELPLPDWKPGEPIRLKDIWGMAESQETVDISPDMFREFILPYQAPLLARTGLNHYGCCEKLHERIDDLLKLPNMRRFSVSPWCDQEIMAEKLGKKYIFSRKPNPTNVSAIFDEQIIRKDISDTLQIAGNCALEFIMKDTHTVQNEPWRITRWVQLTYEEIDRYMGG
jgi:hypothetical protein